MMVIPNRGKVVALMLALALVGGLLTLVLLAKPSQANPPPTTKTAALTAISSRSTPLSLPMIAQVKRSKSRGPYTLSTSFSRLMEGTIYIPTTTSLT
jgi:hypothetical protein